jgi:predicted dehydrogenase
MAERLGVGLIGVGRRGYDLAMCVARLRDQIDLEVAALFNRTRSRAERAREDLRTQYHGSGEAPEIRIHESYQELIDDPTVDLVMICTPQYAHKEPAVAALRSGKNVYVDKPLAHNLEDARAIHREQERTGNTIIMSFTRRFERPWISAYDLVKQQDAIGPVRMIQVRNVIPYHTFFHTWHRRREWSGGALGDKMSHIFDVFNWYSGDTPERLSAFGGQAVFGPRDDAPERCSLCNRDCPYRVAPYRGAAGAGVTDGDGPAADASADGAAAGAERERPDAMVDFDDTRLSEQEIIKRHDTCVWYPGADINDHGLVSVDYRSGIKASLFWTLFGPDSDDQETMEIVGDRGRIVLTRHLGTIDLVTDYGRTHRVLDEKAETFGHSHFGADDNFVLELDRFCKGAQPSVTATEGLTASRMVEAAHRSIDSGGNLVLMDEVAG